ncbi:carboxypeptidase-like regulatory domain-containing protein [Flavobacterium sp. GT3R68]|uniref:carboxypeptidase-like regulatory domain-containing protein n=1 Tax=Flavobacterium sp. GT3R68 TaxID=2594437 RepID=UPI000F87F010|nr:carboxypeptidase-like regulatory domain-containing protein [Flavobacterium sp. GT3R68]RTY95838.1 TonB-dependent receptor [Flavobacterium sp. GSN2]TRW93610.1 TonB-dependent receptor [Flavobacterium sp. GT3R68]
MKKLVISTLFVMQVFFVFAQTTTGISGKVLDAKTQKPLQNVVASIQNTNLTQLTDAAGKFSFGNVAVGNQLLQIRTTGFKDQLLPIEIVAGKMLDLGTIVLEEDQSVEQQASLVTITESDLGDDNSGSESTSSLLQASKDAFQQAAAFNWGQARFRIRGLDNEYSNTMINGVSMNKIYDGRPQWGNWGGLNDATRNQEFTMGSAPSDYTFGGILGTQEINTRASIYRPGTRVSFSGTNTNYNWRMMGTHVSGMDKDGWAYVISAGRRWAVEGYFEGTDYSANSIFASVEKKFNDKHSLNFTSIYAENSRGKNSPNTAEVSRIAGTKYNSYWGWQDGKKRNSRDKNVEEPILMLSHYWKLSSKTNLNTNVTYQTGRIGNSRLDFQGANNPDPTYYRNLPSYYTATYNGTTLVGNQEPYLTQAQNATFLTNRQINWNALYQANQNTAAGNSVYVLYEDRTDDTQLTANSLLNSQLSDNISFNAGATFRKLRSHNHKNLLDLLGGDYFLNIDTFGSNYNQTQPDLNNQNGQIVENQSYGYNYNMFANTLDAFTQFKFNYKKVDFYLAQTFVRSEYQREGLYRNGYYPNNSFGKSNSTTFENFGFKGGMTYKITGQHYLTGNAVYMTKAPSMRNVFPNARINNNTVEDIDSENITSADVSYIIRAPKFKARLTGYYSTIKNATETSFFFADGVSFDDGDPSTEDATSNFVAETVTGINKKNMGAELGMEYQVTSTIKVTANAAYGQFTYDNNPTVSLNNDALATSVSFGEAKLKNYRLPGSPQEAYSVGLEYRDPKFWWIGANANYLASNYIDVAPLLRTNNFFNNPADPFGLPFSDIDDARAEQLLKQERFDDFYLVNLSGGKSWRVKGKTIGIFATVNNVFDVTYKTGGFEQSRNANYRELNQDVSSGTPVFAPKYFYGYGRTYFVNLYVQF